MQFPIVSLPEYLAVHHLFMVFHQASFSIFLTIFIIAALLLAFIANSKDKAILKFFWKVFFVSLAGIFLGGYLGAIFLLFAGIWVSRRLLIAGARTLK